MVKIFRTFRQKLLKENRYSKYLLYASGEVLLVVIGILIALYVNDRYQKSLDKQNEHYYLSQLANDLSADSTYLIREKNKYERNLQKVEALVDELNKENNQSSFNAAFREYIDSVWYALYFVSSDATYTEMKSSGKLGLISDRGLRNKIVDVYNLIDLLRNYYRSNNSYQEPIDRVLAADLGMAKYIKEQAPLFEKYITEDELYRMKEYKFELESNAANWHWVIQDILPDVNTLLGEIKDVLQWIRQSLHER